MVDNEHLKCTATLPLYMTSESAVSRTNFSTLLLPLFYEIHIYGFKCCSTREDLSNDVSVINVGLILTDLRWLQLVSTSQNLISNLFEKKNWVSMLLYREDLSIDISMANVGLILTNLRWFQLFVTCQNSNFELFWKKSNFWVSTV